MARTKQTARKATTGRLSKKGVTKQRKKPAAKVKAEPTKKKVARAPRKRLRRPFAIGDVTVTRTAKGNNLYWVAKRIKGTIRWVRGHGRNITLEQARRAFDRYYADKPIARARDLSFSAQRVTRGAAYLKNPAKYDYPGLDNIGTKRMKKRKDAGKPRKGRGVRKVKAIKPEPLRSPAQRIPVPGGQRRPPTPAERAQKRRRK